MRMYIAIVIAALSCAHGEARVAVKTARALAGDVRNVEEQLKYYVYTRKNAQKGDIIEPNVESVIRSIYSPLKPTTISIHGWLGERDAAENSVITSAKLDLEDCNVIVVDWSAIGQDEYEDAVAAAPAIGEAIAKFIILLHKNFAVKLEQFHLVGFSIGAQIAGFAGQSVYSHLDAKVQRITGLDPAGAIYEDVSDPNERLSADDARFVDVIHTNGGGYGYRAPCGYADYYPNGGQQQPNCAAENNYCSHIRAYELVKEMWSMQNEFVATKCSSAEEMNFNVCKWVNVVMGQSALNAGLYYLETNGVYPFSKGSFVFTYL